MFAKLSVTEPDKQSAGMDMPNSMEHIVVTQFIESLPVVLKPCHVNQPFIPRLLRTMKEIICDRSRSTLILRVLVEATTPLAKFGVGLCTAEILENDLKVCRLILKDCGPSSSAQYVMPVSMFVGNCELYSLKCLLVWLPESIAPVDNTFP